LEKKTRDSPLDLFEMRRQITALRAQHSDNARVTHLLNRLLIKIAYLTEPESATHAARLRETFAMTMAEIEKTIATNPATPGKANS
jgi:hypothetical protein